MKDGAGAITLGELNRLPVSVRVGAGVVFALILVIYVFYPAYPTATGKSLAGWTWAACNSANGFLHGRLVPLVLPWLGWWAWRERRGEEVRPSGWGLVWVGIALLLFFASVRAIQPRWALFGVPFLVLGVTQYFFGGRMAKAMILPAFFWWFAIPVPGLEAKLMGDWQVNVTQVSYEAGTLLGMDLTKNGSVIVANGAAFQIAEG